MAQIIEPGFAGTVQNNPLGVDAQSLYNAYDARRVEGRNDQLAYAQKLDNDWNTIFMPAVVNMMHSSDPRVKAAAEDRYMQGVMAYANARQVKLSDEDLQALRGQFRARYSEEGNTNAELGYLAAREGVGGAGSAGTGASAPALGAAKATGGATGAATTPAKKDRTPEGGQAVPTAAYKPYSAPITPADAIAGILRQAANPMGAYGPKADDFQPVGSSPDKPAPTPLATPVIDQKRYTAKYSEWANDNSSVEYLHALAARYTRAHQPTEAKAAMDAAAAKERAAKRTSSQQRESFASRGAALPGPNGEPVEATIADNGPEIVVSADDVQNEGADEAVRKAIEAKIVQGGPNGATVVGGQAAGGTGGMGGTPPETVSRQVPPVGTTSGATSSTSATSSFPLAEPLVKSQARTEKTTSSLAQKAQDFLSKAQAATSPAEAQRATKQSYLCLDRLARVAASTPEFKQASADTLRKWNIWTKNATPEELAAAGLQQVSDARSASLDRASREKIAFAQIQAQKEIEGMKSALLSEQTKRTASQVLESIYKSGIEDIVVKKFKGDVTWARQQSKEVNDFYNLAGALTGNDATKWVGNGGFSGFFGGKHQEVINPNSTEYAPIEAGLAALNSETTKTKIGGGLTQQGGSSSGGSSQGTYSSQDVQRILADLAKLRRGE